MSRLDRVTRRHSRGSWDRTVADTEILDCLAEAGANLQSAGELIAELFHTWPDDSSHLRAKITDCEHVGDELTHRILSALHRRKASPFDRGQVHRLTGAIDDVVDDIEEAAQETALYQVHAPMEQAEALASVVRDAGRELSRALHSLREPDRLDPHLAEIRRLEKEGDQIHRDAIASLFDGGIDPLQTIRWKDILGALEEAIDRARNAADIISGVIASPR